MRLFVYSLVICASAAYWKTCIAPVIQREKPAEYLAGKTFRSVVEREVGLGEHGPVMGHWYLRFNPIQAKHPRTYFWDHSDVRSAGSYQITPDGVLTISGMEVEYDSKRDRIFWEGLWYERIK